MKTTHLIYRLGLGTGTLAALALPSGCLQTMPPPPDQSSFAAIERRSAELLRELGPAGGDTPTAARQIVTIQGDDILLPEASPNLGAGQGQTYYFDVVAEDPHGRTMRELLETGALRIETIGAKATLVEPPPQQTTNGEKAKQPEINTSKARLSVSSTEDGGLQPFTIRAWYPGKIGAADPNEWSATRRVQVFYGDIRTRVQIVSRTEAEGMFGKTFAEHFYVGRVFLRNRSTTKSLAVYTTSMRVPVLIYRRTELPGGLTPVGAERLDHFAEERWKPDTTGVALDKEAEGVVKDFIDQAWYRGARHDPFLRTSASPRGQGNAAHVSRAERDALVSRVLATWARLSAADQTNKRNEESLTRQEQERLLDAALVGEIPKTTEKRDTAAGDLATQTLQGRPVALSTQRGRELILRVWALREHYKQQANENLKEAQERIADLLPWKPWTAPFPEEQKPLYQEIVDALRALSTLSSAEAIDGYLTGKKQVAGETAESLKQKIEEVKEAQNHADFLRAASALPQAVRQKLTAQALRDAEIKKADARIAELFSWETQPSAPTTEQRKLYERIQTALHALSRIPSSEAVDAYLAGEKKVAGETAESLKQKIEEVKEAQDRADFLRAALFLPQAVRQKLAAQALQDAEVKKADARIAELFPWKHIPSAPPAEQKELYTKIQTALSALSTLPDAKKVDAYLTDENKIEGETRASLNKKIDAVLEAQNRADFHHAELLLPQYVRQQLAAQALKNHLADLDTKDHQDAQSTVPKTRAVPPSTDDSVCAAIAELRERALWQTEAGTASGRAKATVNLGGQDLALSPDPHRQRQLVEGGYVWRDAYRPMTFQAVLNSVMFTHANDPKTVTVKTLEALASIAGGAVSLVGKPSTDLLRSTNFFSSVFVPTLRATLVEDLNKHITNLGDMAMDTVLLIPPNDSVDRYIFFPRDAIYNFPDEFDPVSPGYIRGVEGRELFVEAALVNADQVVRGGSVASGTLVAQALNEGERSEAARLLSIADTQAKLRTIELGNLNARIEAVMAAAQTGAENLSPERKEEKLESARAEARKMLAQFTAYFGPDQSGVIASTLAKHSITAQDARPVALPGTLLRLPRGTTSVPWPLQVTDPDTPLKSLVFEKKADEAVDTWLADVKFINPGTTPPHAVYIALPPGKAASKEAARQEVGLTVRDLGGNVVSFTQPIYLSPPKIDTPVLTDKATGSVPVNDKGDIEPGTYTATLAPGIATLSITAPLYDANTTLYKLATVKDDAGYIASVKPGPTTGSGTISLAITLDTSPLIKATTDPTTIEIPVCLVPIATALETAALERDALARITIKLTIRTP